MFSNYVDLKNDQVDYKVERTGIDLGINNGILGPGDNMVSWSLKIFLTEIVNRKSKKASKLI